MPLDKLDSLGFSPFHSFSMADLDAVPDTTGVYAICQGNEVVFVGMAGQNRRASLRWQLLYHFSGQGIDLFTQHVLFGRILCQDNPPKAPKEARRLCREYIRRDYKFRFLVVSEEAAALRMHNNLKRKLKPAANLTLPL